MEGVDVYDIKKIKLDKTPRPAQIKLLEFIKESIKSNHKGIIVDAPVGCLTKNEKINIYVLKDINIDHDIKKTL